MADSEDHRNRSLKPERPDPTPESEKHSELEKKRDRKKKHKHRRRDSSSDDEDYSSSSSESEDDRRRSKGKKRRRSRSSRRRRSRSESDSEEESSSDSESDSESDRRRERRRRREKDERRRREKEKERRKRKKDKREKKKKKEKGNKGAVTNSWGKYGIIRESDMWNKRPEFTAWLLEVKQVNMESLSNWEEKQMFKEFMEDHNTTTFPSKKYYNLEAYHHHELQKEMKKGLKKLPKAERTIFNDEEQRRLELMREREKQKEAEVEVLKQSMQSGMAQAMKEQARLREEMILHFRLGNHEAAAAIQKRLDPDPPM